MIAVENLSKTDKDMFDFRRNTDMLKNKKKMMSYKEFLYIMQFRSLVAVFSYYPRFGWI